MSDNLLRKSVRIQEAPVHHVQQKTEDEDEKDNAPRGPGCWLHSTNSHNIQECAAYAKADVNERWGIVMDYPVCWCFLKRGHCQADCYNSNECGVEGCKSKHHKTLHRTDNQSGKNKDAYGRPTNATGEVAVHHSANEGSELKVCLFSADGGKGRLRWAIQHQYNVGHRFKGLHNNLR